MRMIIIMESSAAKFFRVTKEDLQFGIVPAIFNFFQGRATTFAIVFTVAGIILAFRGKLDGNYALFVTAVQGFVFAHSCKEDWASYKDKQIQNTTVVNNVTVDANPQK